MKKLIISLIIIIAITLGGYYYYKVSHPAKPIKTVTVKFGDILQKATAVGDIIPKHSIIIKSQVAGVVGKLYVDSGDQVTIGEKLVLVKPNPAPADLATAISSVQIDKDNLSSDRKSVDSFNQMLAQQVISTNYAAYISAVKLYNTDKNTLDLDQQKLNLLQSGNATIGGKLIQNNVVSPINGFVLQKMVDIGDTIVATQQATQASSVFSLANMQDLEFQGSVDEVDADKVKTNMHAKVTLAAFPQQPFNGTVARISLQSDKKNASSTASSTDSDASTTTTSPFTNGFKIIIEHLQFPAHITLRSGFSATASIVVKKLTHILLIPERVLSFDGDKTYVTVIGSNNTKIKTLVKTGIADGINIQILSGLKNGQKVSDEAPSSNQDKDESNH